MIPSLASSGRRTVTIISDKDKHFPGLCRINDSEIEGTKTMKSLFPIADRVASQIGNQMSELMHVALSYLPQHHRQWRSRNPAHPAKGDPADPYRRSLQEPQVFDWTVPKEWNLNDAYVKTSSGEKIIDVKESNLHLLNYSIPIKKKVSLAELKQHLFTLPEHPAWIPYRTSYYNENWGFCISHNQFEGLKEDTYEVVIDTTLRRRSLNLRRILSPRRLGR